MPLDIKPTQINWWSSAAKFQPSKQLHTARTAGWILSHSSLTKPTDPVRVLHSSCCLSISNEHDERKAEGHSMRNSWCGKQKRLLQKTKTTLDDKTPWLILSEPLPAINFETEHVRSQAFILEKLDMSGLQIRSWRSLLILFSAFDNNDCYESL